MTVLDQLVYFASLYGRPADVARRDARDWLARFRIPDYADRRAEELSKGNQQKVQFIAAVLHDPDVLLMDEPFTGLDPVNLAIVDSGRVVASGTLGELKRTSRARTVRLGVAGETMPAWLGALPGVAAMRPGAGFAELELAGDVAPSDVLARVLAHGAEVTRYEVAEPSLEAIFIELVGRPAGDDATLAGTAPPAYPDPDAEARSVAEGAA
jgi:ABC-2 type transport system ATP-binding protein